MFQLPDSTREKRERRAAREVANLAEATRQQKIADAMVSGGNFTRAEAYSRFGCLAGLI